MSPNTLCLIFLFLLDTESIVKNGKAKIYWNYPFSTLTVLQANKPDVTPLRASERAMYSIKFFARVEINLVRKEEHKGTKYQDLLFEPHKLYPDPACRPEAHVLVAMQEVLCPLGQ